MSPKFKIQWGKSLKGLPLVKNKNDSVYSYEKPSVLSM